jgi:predicted nucleic acid-binding protein
VNGEFVDTSAWIGLFDANDANHAAASMHWAALRQTGTPLYTTDYIFDETVTLARRRVGHAAAVQLGTALLTSQHLNLIELTRDIREEAWTLFQQYDDKVLSFTDCTSFVVMKRLALFQAFTFDDDFAQVGFIRQP